MKLSHHHRPTAPAPGLGATRTHGRGQQGYALVMFGLLLVPLLVMVSFSVDVGYWYNRASQMQKAADAGALAGVVWLPDLATARNVALDLSNKNGFDDSLANITVTVTGSAKSNRRLIVQVCDSNVGSFFYKQLTGKGMSLCRKAFAEYQLPVPLGSPRNFFGTGQLLASAGTGFPAEQIFQSVNPYCTDKVNGDRYQSGYDGGTCSGSVNTEYRASGYTTYIDVPESRTSAIDVLLYDARYSEDLAACPVPLVYDWTKADGSAGFDDYGSNRTFSGPDRRWWNGSAWIELLAGQSASARYWQTRTSKCPSPDAAIDDYRQAGGDNYTFTLQKADNTPLDDSDNPVMCAKTFTPTTPFDNLSFATAYLGSTRWNLLCTIPLGASYPAGRYVLNVHNQGSASSPENDGSNQYGVVARYTNASGHGLCDGRVTLNCPRVFGKDAISVRAASDASVASFYLAEIAAEHNGKILKLELFDPGEGGNSIAIMKPTGTNSWAKVSFDWSSPGVGSGTTTDLDVTGSRFNGKLVSISVKLDGYNPPSDNNWWKIQYTFTAGVTVTDRTTWSARVVGDPVHLVEET